MVVNLGVNKRGMKLCDKLNVIIKITINYINLICRKYSPVKKLTNL